MADFRLPMSAGAETSSVSLDPRRQVAPVDDEVTQVTQSGGGAGVPTVRQSIEQQFGAAPQGASADDFTNSTSQGTPAQATPDAKQGPGYVRDVPRAVAKNLEKAYSAKRGVWSEITKKKADLVRVKKKDAQKKHAAALTAKTLARRALLQGISKKAAAQRATVQQGIRTSEAQHAIKTDGVKTEVRTDNVKATDVQNVAAVVDPAKKSNV